MRPGGDLLPGPEWWLPARPRSTRWAAVLLAGAAAALLTGGPAPLEGPSAPYDHPGRAEESVARPARLAGDAAVVVAGLAGTGTPCVQARANAVAVQTRCAGPHGTVDLVSSPAGDVLYAEIDLARPDADGPETSRTRLDRLLDASFLRLWPADRATVDGLVADAEPDRDFTGSIVQPRDEDDQYPTHEEVTEAASWSLWSHYGGQLLRVRVRTPALTDRSWPFGGEHYATTMTEAAAAMTRQGFVCHGDGCYREADRLLVAFDVHRGQIVSAALVLRSSARAGDDPADDPSGQWVRGGLPFLAPAVREAVGARIEECRVERRGFGGVVAGTALHVDAAPGGLLPDGRPAADLVVRIGVPLLHVE